MISDLPNICLNNWAYLKIQIYWKSVDLDRRPERRTPVVSTREVPGSNIGCLRLSCFSSVSPSKSPVSTLNEAVADFMNALTKLITQYRRYTTVSVLCSLYQVESSAIGRHSGPSYVAEGRGRRWWRSLQINTWQDGTHRCCAENISKSEVELHHSIKCKGRQMRGGTDQWEASNMAAMVNDRPHENKDGSLHYNEELLPTCRPHVMWHPQPIRAGKTGRGNTHPLVCNPYFLSFPFFKESLPLERTETKATMLTGLDHPHPRKARTAPRYIFRMRVAGRSCSVRRRESTVHTRCRLRSADRKLRVRIPSWVRTLEWTPRGSPSHAKQQTNEWSN